MDIVNIAEAIQKRIGEMEKARSMFKKITHDKSLALATYTNKLAEVIVRLTNGQKYTINGAEVQNPKTTVIKEIAKGICANEAQELSIQECTYTNCKAYLDALKCEINAYQTLYRNQEEM